jgi:hypothetical protein
MKRGIKLGCFSACLMIWQSMFAAEAYGLKKQANKPVFYINLTYLIFKIAL